jgi:outer membrane protein assembly factor BamB
VVEARAMGRPSTIAWGAELDGYSGPIAAGAGRVVAAVGGTGRAAGLELRGEPGAAVVALDAATGAIAWKLAVDATDWSVIASLAALSDGVLVGGTFAGTLRIAERVVSSGGRTDGFVARMTASGAVAWLIRIGGVGADTVQAVAAVGNRIAIAGTFAASADLLGRPLQAFDERSMAADGFVAELDPAGAARWVQTFGGKADEAVAGVAIDAAGRIAVAASIRDTVHVAGADHVVEGPGDGMVAWWSPGGGASAVTLLGGADFDGLRAIAPAGEHVIAGGFFSGALRLGDRSLTTGGGDDAFLAELDASGSVVASWPVSGEGREEVTALAALPGGFIAGIAHTAAASVGDDRLPAPRDPLSGAALVVRASH